MYTANSHRNARFFILFSIEKAAISPEIRSIHTAISHRTSIANAASDTELALWVYRVVAGGQRCQLYGRCEVEGGHSLCEPRLRPEHDRLTTRVSH